MGVYRGVGSGVSASVRAGRLGRPHQAAVARPSVHVFLPVETAHDGRAHADVDARHRRAVSQAQAKRNIRHLDVGGVDEELRVASRRHQVSV